MDIFSQKSRFSIVLMGFLGKIMGRGNPMWLPWAATRGRPYKSGSGVGAVMEHSTDIKNSLQIDLFWKNKANWNGRIQNTGDKRQKKKMKNKPNFKLGKMI